MLEECDEETGDCNNQDVVNGDSYVIHFNEKTAYNFIAKNSIDEDAFVEMNYNFFDATALSGASMIILGYSAASIAALF